MMLPWYFTPSKIVSNDNQERKQEKEGETEDEIVR